MYEPRTEDTIFRIDISGTHVEELARELCKSMGWQTHLNITPENRAKLARKLWDVTYETVWAFIEENLEEN